MLYVNSYKASYIYILRFLYSNKSMTLPVESRFNYVTIDISPNGSMLVAINTGKISFYSTYWEYIIYNNIQ